MEQLLSEEESGRLTVNWTELNVIKPKLNSFRSGGGQVRGSIVEAKIDDSIALEHSYPILALFVLLPDESICFLDHN